ncbi:MAG: hypothetical protein ACETWG_09965 [Candidatus Neomarinimicrobiota bacterium]
MIQKNQAVKFGTLIATQAPPFDSHGITGNPAGPHPDRTALPFDFPGSLRSDFLLPTVGYHPDWLFLTFRLQATSKQS